MTTSQGGYPEHHPDIPEPVCMVLWEYFEIVSYHWHEFCRCKLSGDIPGAKKAAEVIDRTVREVYDARAARRSSQ